MSLSTSFWPDAPRPVRLFQSIQVLRACAAWGVVLYHIHVILNESGQSGWFSLFSNGYLGVDLFFVISGFIITSTSRGYLHRPGSLRTYLSKRFWRIYPVYWLCLSSIVFYAFIRGIGTGSDSMAALFSLQNLVSNFLLFPTELTFLHDSWSLSHEVYFYLLVALVLVSRALIVVPVLVLGGTLLSAWGWGADRVDVVDSLIFSPFNVEFGLGVLLSLLVGKRTPGLLPGSGLLFLLAAGMIYHVGITSVWNRVVWAGLLSFALIFLVTAWEYRRARRIPPLLIRLGDASYVLYLLHGSVLLALHRLLISFQLVPYAPVVFALAVPLLSWACLVIHRRVELPLLTWGHHRFTRPLPRIAHRSGASLSDLVSTPESEQTAAGAVRPSHSTAP